MIKMDKLNRKHICSVWQAGITCIFDMWGIPTYYSHTVFNKQVRVHMCIYIIRSD